MQLREVIGAARRRRAVLVAVPALAAVIVIGILAASPRQYQATGTVLAPALVGGTTGVQYSGANGVKSFVANFGVALTSTPVVNQVAGQTRTPSRRVRAGLSASEVGTSTVVRVIYKTTKRAEAVPVARAAAATTIVSLFRTQVDLAREPVDAANGSLTDIEHQMAALGNQTGLIVPDKDYEVRAQQIATLQATRAGAEANGHAAAAASLGAQIDQLRRQLDSIAPTVEQFTALQNEKSAAVVRLDEAEKSLREAQAQLQAADPRRVVSVGPVSTISVVGAVAPKASVAAGAGLFLALGIVAALELWEAQGRPQSASMPAVGRAAVASRV